MTDVLRLEISKNSPGEWRIVERSDSTAEHFARHPFDEQELDALLAEIDQCLHSTHIDATAQYAQLRRLGVRLSELMLPEEMRTKVVRADGAVEFILAASAIRIPVEMLPHGGGVLAERVPVSCRWASEFSPGGNVRIARAEKKQALIIADPAGDLPDAGKEGELVFRILRSRAMGYQCRFKGRSMSRGELSKELPDTDLLHIAGHYAAAPSENATGVVMSDGLWIPDRYCHSPEIVFANCCRAGSGSGTMENLSLVERFLYRGSRHVVAPFLAVSDRAANRFAVELYQAMTKGMSVSHAVFSARKAIGPSAWMYRHFGPVENGRQAPGMSPTGAPKRAVTLALVIAVGALTAASLAWLLWPREQPEVQTIPKDGAVTSIVEEPYVTSVQNNGQSKAENHSPKEKTADPKARVAPELFTDF